MAERIVAKAKLDSGPAFSVEIANLTSKSVFLITDRRLSFRQRVTVSLEGVEIRGEIAFVAQDHPRGVVLVFEPPPGAEAELARWMEQGEVLHASTIDEMWSESTEPAPEILDEPTSEDAQIDPHLFRAAFLLDNQPVVIDPDTDEVAKETFDSGDDTAVQIQLPELEDDGTIKFATAADYKAQYTSDIVKGGLIARSAPLPIGTQKMVRLSVPGLPEPVALSARVGFVGSGTVGLMIDSFAKYKVLFEKLFNDLT